MKDYKIRSVRFTTTFVFDDKYDNCSDATDDEIIEEARRQLADALWHNGLSLYDFEEEFITDKYHNLDKESEE